jgi:hypothetical protein
VDEHALFVAVVALVAFVALVVLVATTHYANWYVEKRMKTWGWSDEELIAVLTIGRSRNNPQYRIKELAFPLP